MSSVPFLSEDAVVYGKPEQVTPSVRRIVARNPGPYTYHGTCSYIVGQGEVAVVDPGPDDEDHIDAILGALDKGERVTHILATHSHADHSPGTRPLQERTGAPIHGYGPQLGIDDPDDTRVVFGDPEADPDPAKPPGPKGGDLAFQPDVVARDGDVIEGPTWSLECVHTPGHASNHLCYRIGGDQALCTGDQVMGWATSVISPPDGNLADYLASMEGLLGAVDDRTYLPGHGPPIGDPQSFVGAVIDHRRRRDEEILDLLGRGPTTIAEMVPVLYAAVTKKLWSAAAGSVYAHLLRLEGMGVVEADDGGPVVRAGRIRLSLRK